MDKLHKLSILAESAKYDVSCSSSGSVSRSKSKNSTGDIHVSGICHTFTSDGRCVSLFKVLLSNECIYDCKYCINRVSNDIGRATFTPEEICDITMNFYKRNYIEGLFLSSAVVKNPDHTMERLLYTVRLLREKHEFRGYIHLKAIPGADSSLVMKAGEYADRMSSNIELPSRESLQLLAPQKTYTAILNPMRAVNNKLIETRQDRTFNKRLFVPAGQSTQMIVGASPDSDGHIIRLSQDLYKKLELKRVYYSSYIPVNHDNLLPAVAEPSFLREHRLYQADWLLRFYSFTAEEILDYGQNFNLSIDPKTNYALNHLDLFPVEVNKAPYKTLLRVPGVGIRSAKRIVDARKWGKLGFEDLIKMGVVLKRAKFFLLCNGRHYMGMSFNPDSIRDFMLMDDAVKRKTGNGIQLSIFDINKNDYSSAVSGEY